MMPRPEAVLFQFDDVKSSVYSRAYPILAAAGFPATAFAASDDVGASGYMTLAQYQEVYAAGWDIGNHTVNHPHLNTLTQAQQETELGGCATYLTANGMPRGALHVAYPFGDYNADTLAAMTALGARTGRQVNPAAQPIPIATPHELKGIVSLYTTSKPLADAKAALHSTTPGKIVTYLCHGISDDGDASTYAEADFAALVAYVKSLGVRVVTISQLWDYMQAGYVWP